MQERQDISNQGDGRKARKTRNKNKALSAFLELVERQRGLPTAEEIAEEAGVSRRSIFRYFESLDQLVVAAYNYQVEKLQSKFPPPALPDNREECWERIPALIDHLSSIYEDTASIREALAVKGLPPEVQDKINDLRSHSLRERLADYFQSYLNQLGEESARINILYALEVSLSSESWDYLRGPCGLSRKQAQQVWQELLDNCLR